MTDLVQEWARARFVHHAEFRLPGFALGSFCSVADNSRSGKRQGQLRSSDHPRNMSVHLRRTDINEQPDGDFSDRSISS